MSKLHYTTINEADNRTPVYLLHTTPLDGTYLRKSLDDLEIDNLGDRSIYVIDLLSHGKSEIVEDLSFINIIKEIDTLRSELGHEKIIMSVTNKLTKGSYIPAQSRYLKDL